MQEPMIRSWCPCVGHGVLPLSQGEGYSPILIYNVFEYICPFFSRGAVVATDGHSGSRRARRGVSRLSGLALLLRSTAR